MSWVTELFNTDEKKRAGFAAGIFGFLVVVVTNIDKLNEIYKIVAEYVEPSAIHGDWVGVYREWSTPGKQFETHGENFSATVRGEHVTGDINILEPAAHYHFIGRYKDNFLILEYRSNDPFRPGAVAYVLQGRPESGELIGFWTGYDPDLRIVMSCPYVLSRQTRIDKVKQEHRLYLERDCYR